MDIGFLKKIIEKPSTERVKLIEKTNQDLSISNQCQLLGLRRSRLYYKPWGHFNLLLFPGDKIISKLVCLN